MNTVKKHKDFKNVDSREFLSIYLVHILYAIFLTAPTKELALSLMQESLVIANELSESKYSKKLREEIHNGEK